MFLLYISKESAQTFILVSIIAVLVLVGILIALFVRDHKLEKLKAVKAAAPVEETQVFFEPEKNLEVTKTEELTQEVEEMPSETDEVQENVEVETVADEVKEPVLEQEEITKEEVIEPVKEEKLTVETSLPLAEMADSDGGYNIVIRYRKSHQAKLILDPELHSNYQELKDYFLSYKKVKSRVSFKKEKFSFGREVLVNMIVRGKRLYLYFNLSPNEMEEKYHLVDVSEKTIGEKTPSLLRVKSARSVKYAKELFDILVTKYNLVALNPDKYVPFDYTSFLQEKSFEQLLSEGLIVKYETKTRGEVKVDPDDDEVVEIVHVLQSTIDNAQKVLDKIQEKVNQPPLEVTPEVAEKLVSDEKVKEETIIEKSNASGKMMIINIDTISDMFKDGDEVTLEALKKKKLLPASCKRVKVLARGSLDKALNVKANEFSKQAMKMIIAKKGKVIIC